MTNQNPVLRGTIIIAVALTGMLLIAACGDDDDSGASSDPEAALNVYADGINSGSTDETMEAFAEDAVMIEHPLHAGTLEGKDQIRVGVSETVTFARSDPDPYTVSDVEVEGETVTWAYVWVNDAGEEFCAAGNKITVDDDDLIVELRWGDEPGPCEG